MRKIGGEPPAKILRPIITRQTKFTSVEANRFTAAVARFWQSHESLSELPVPVLLAAEREAILSIGVEADLRSPAICRRKILDGLAADRRKDYVDLLLSLARQYAGDGQNGDARAVLEAVTVGDPGNWHALKELAIILGRGGHFPLARRRFEEARQALGNYRQKFEVAGDEVWWADLNEVRFSLADQALPAAEIGVKLQLFANLAGREVNRRADYWQQTELALEGINGRLPAEEIYAAFEPAGLGQKALTHYSRHRIRTIFGRDGLAGEREINAYLKAIERKKLLPGAALAELKAYAGEFSLDKRLLLVYGELEGLIAEIKNDPKKAADESSAAALKERLRLLIPLARDSKGLADAPEFIFKDLTALLEELIGERAEIPARTAVRLATALAAVDERLADQIREVFAQALKDSRRRDDFHRELVLAVANLSVTLDKIFTLSSAEQAGNISRIPNQADFKEKEIIHDFFFVFLRGNEETAAMFRKIYGTRGEPLAMRSRWFEMAAERAADLRQKEKYYSQAAAANERNFAARIELARLYGSQGQFHQSRRLIDEVSAASSDPLIKLRLCHLAVANLCLETVKLAGQAGKAKTVEQKIAAAEQKTAEAREHLRAIGPDEQFLVEPDWRFMLKNMAFLYSQLHHLEAALGYLDECLRLDRLDKEAVVMKGNIYLKRGNFVGALALFKELLTGGGEGILEFRYYFAEALFQLEAYSEAVKYINTALAHQPDQLNFLLLKARGLIGQGRPAEGEEIIRQVETRLKKASVTAVERNLVMGTIALARASVLTARNENGKAAAAYRQAIQFFAQDFEMEFQEIEARWRLTRLMFFDNLGREGERSQEKVAAEGEALLRKFPFFEPGHQALIGPLAALGREAEAVAHFRFSVEHSRHLASDAIIYAFSLACAGEAAVRREAKELIFSLRNVYGEEKFHVVMRKVVNSVRETNPPFEIDPDFLVFS